MSGSKSLSLKLTLRTPTGQGHVSPLIDTTRLVCSLNTEIELIILYQEQLQSLLQKLQNTGGSSEAKYQTRPIILANESTALRCSYIGIRSRNF